MTHHSTISDQHSIGNHGVNQSLKRIPSVTFWIAAPHVWSRFLYSKELLFRFFNFTKSSVLLIFDFDIFEMRVRFFERLRSSRERAIATIPSDGHARIVAIRLGSKQLGLVNCPVIAPNSWNADERSRMHQEANRK